MAIAMLLAHLVGDYLLQPNWLANWKSRHWSGVLVHCAIVIAVTWLLMVPFDGRWWAGLAIIGGGHLAVDIIHYALVRHNAFVREELSPLFRYLLDQLAHLTLITAALLHGGFLTGLAPAAVAETLRNDERWLLYALGYAFVTMPSWVLIKFVSSDLILRAAPDWNAGPSKYVGIAERLVLTTLVLTGQLILLPLAAAPRLIINTDDTPKSLAIVDLLFSLLLAVAVGILLRQV